MTNCSPESSSQTVTCEKCGKEIAISHWPFCPHGQGSFTAIPDSIPGGLWIENFGPQPMRFDSHSEKRRYMDVHGIQSMVRHIGTPGSDKSPHTTRFV